MLRKALLIVGVCLLAIGAGVGLAGGRAFLPFLIWGAVIVAAVLFERWRYRPGDAGGPSPAESGGESDPQSAPGRGWDVTDERFVDPETGQAMQVLYNAATGERRYRPIGHDGARS